MPQEWLQGPIDTLRTTLSSVSAFQTFVGVGSAGAAAKSIHDFEAVAEEFPLAAINSGGSGTASIEIAENVEELFQTGSRIRIRGSSADDGVRTVRTGSNWDGDVTTINVEEALTGGAEPGVAILQPYPCAMIGRSGGAVRRRRGPQSWMTETAGGLWMMFVWEPGDDEFDRDEQLDAVQSQHETFLTLLQDILDGFEALAGTAGYLNVRSITEADPPTRGKTELNGGRPFWFATFELAIG